MTKRTLADRFWSKVDIAGPDECWPWTGCRRVFGHGRIGVGGKARTASRVAYELAKGPIPEGKCVLHICDYPPCCNPAHLYAGTFKDNVRDAIVRGRRNTRFGERHQRAKLTEGQVRLIRSLRASGTPYKELVRRFDVSLGTVSDIVRGKIWRHLLPKAKRQ